MIKKTFKGLLALFALFVLAAVLFLFWPFWQRSPPPPENEEPVDVVMIGAGIMSITLASYLQELQPDWRIDVFERLNGVSLESSDGWHNAGTGHSGFAELNYTPEQPDGSIAVARAINIAEQFEVSRQFWSHLVEAGRLDAPGDFINATPHMSFVWGEENIEFLRKRHAAMSQNPLFYGMEYSEDPAQIAQWAPIMMEGRDPSQRIAATWMPLGTDINFGVLTRQMAEHLQQSPTFDLQLGQEVRGLHKNDDGTWTVSVHNLASGEDRYIRARFVFVGAGGAALRMLQYSGIPEADNYAGFPVGGQFLATNNPQVASRHDVKAYGKAEAGSPPMSVPHIDARQLDGEPALLFGPFALQSTKFLMNGSWFDLFSSVNHNNVFSMLRVGADNVDLIQYLVQQVMLSDEDRMEELRKYYPNANPADWRLVTAGQRVQIIKKDPEKGAILQFGTEIVSDQDRTIAALLGASPGASTSPKIMLDVLARIFPEQVNGPWAERLREIIPSYGRNLNDSAALTNEIRGMTSKALNLPFVAVPVSGLQSQDESGAAGSAPATPAAATPEDNRQLEMQAL